MNDPGINDGGMDKIHRNVNKMFETMDTPLRENYEKMTKNRDKDVIKNSVQSELVDDVNLMDEFQDRKANAENWHLSKQW